MVDHQRSDLALLYRRAGFGLRPGELDELAADSYDDVVDRLVAGLDDAPDPGGDRIPLPQFSAFVPAAQQRNVEAPQALAVELASLQEWWVDRMIATSTPLREKLALFWHGHFATGVSKVRDPKLMYLQNQLFRHQGGGGFEELTQSVAKDGAMMVWLDIASDKKAHPNENFAREMMELFTIGAGNYRQGDVTAGAEAFTGWTYQRAEYRYAFRPAQHDFGTKTYLGQTGAWNGEDAVRIAVHDPASTRFVVAKLWSHFAYPVEPSDPVVTDIAQSYGKELSISRAVAALFRHPAFTSASSRTGLVKQPIEYLAGAARALGLDARLNPTSATEGSTGTAGPVETGSPAEARHSLATLATLLGQEPFNPPNVGGWGQNGYWLDTATALHRLSAALLLARAADLRELESEAPDRRVGAVATLLGIDGWGPTTAAALSKAEDSPRDLVALALNSPEYVVA